MKRWIAPVLVGTLTLAATAALTFSRGEKPVDLPMVDAAAAPTDAVVPDALAQAAEAPTTASPPAAPASRDEVLAALARRAPELLGSYIRIDTVNPPGNEIEGARFLQGLLAAQPRIETQVLESAPGRGNLYARLRGNGKQRPIVLLNHIDVVPADAAEWNHPPFGGQVVDGAVHGRGALDCKGVGIVHALTLLALAELDVALSRDVILLSTADEETGGRLGAGWLVDNHRELFADAEFVLNEGGFIHRSEGRPLIYNVNAGEKGPCWFRVVATGDPGHASRPAAVTAVSRLVEALSTLLAWQRPLEVGPVVAGYYAAYAALDEEHARQFRQLDRALEDTEFREWFMSDPAAAALVRDTLTPTVLSGSIKTNIVPSQAIAEVDSRLLPGHDCGEFLSEVRSRIAGPYVRVESTDVQFPSSQSPLDNALTIAIESLAAADPSGAVVLPGLSAGFTDSHYFREKGIAAYGFVPLVVGDEERMAVHGPNERVDAAELGAAIARSVALLETLAGSGS